MVDDDGRTPDHDHPISSPCEPKGSDDLKTIQCTKLQSQFLSFSVRKLFFMYSIRFIISAHAPITEHPGCSQKQFP